MWEWAFGILTLSFGFYALVKGRLQVSKKYALKGNSATIVGVLLIAAPIIGAFLTVVKHLEGGISGLSCYTIIGVVIFAAVQAWISSKAPKRKARVKTEPSGSRKKNPTPSQATKKQPVPSSDDGKQSMPDSRIEARPEGLSSKDKLPPKLSAIVTCPKCRMRVLPQSDGTCPSCQARIA
jgi:hypothetical protein